MKEIDNEPAGLDDGLDGSAYREKWFEDVLKHHIRPTIEGLRIRHVCR